VDRQRLHRRSNLGRRRDGRRGDQRAQADVLGGKGRAGERRRAKLPDRERESRRPGNVRRLRRLERGDTGRDRLAGAIHRIEP
jgi:hypothetical protein